MIFCPATPDDQRRKAEYFSTDAQGNQQWEKSRIYAGGYEKQEKDDGNGGIIELEVHYISAGGMLVAMYVIEDGETEGEYYYPHTDHLGSIIHITDAYGNIVHTQGFDAWGRTRNPNDLTYDNIPEGPEWLWRGYTGHEHLDEFGLINMNGRLYDPVVGRMLSPDNYVQSPDFTQSYNRYSYVFNNPLKYYDPDGELAWFVPVLIGAVVGAVSGGIVANNNGNSWVKGAAVGAIIGAGIGLAVTSGLAGIEGVNITGLEHVGGTSGAFGHSGAKSLSWNMTSNAITTANVNIASTWAQNESWDLDLAYSRGLAGAGAGAIGGAAGSFRIEGAGRDSHFGLAASKTQNMVTNVLNGASDRYIRSKHNGLSGGQAAKNAFWGGVEGLISSTLVNSEKRGLAGISFQGDGGNQIFRYSSSVVSNTITSIPGAGFWLGREALSIYAPWQLGAMNNDIAVSLTLSTIPGSFLNTGNFGVFPAIQRKIVGEDYIYASPFLTPVGLRY